MLTRAGRVVVMDFGLARQETEGGGTVSGTPAYMSPEQAAGQTLDARADVYAAGVVLAEMVSPDGIKSFDSRQSVWEGVRSEPAKIPDTPWAAVIQKAVKKDREGRFNSAHTLTRALEDVTLRVEGADDLHPYPGLASFTEEDAEYFFGREAEVEQMWRKLEGPPRTARTRRDRRAQGRPRFCRAGLRSTLRTGWRRLICKPGTRPRARPRSGAGVRDRGRRRRGRARCSASTNPTSRWRSCRRWRRRAPARSADRRSVRRAVHPNTADVQHRFPRLFWIGLCSTSDVHRASVSMRDDFLIRCHRSRALSRRCSRS